MTQPKGTGPQEGDRAPDFSLPSDDGTSIALKDFRGKNVVLYFYPKDDTSGCTKEAIGFTEALKDFATLDAVVLGASRDSVAKHQKFKDKHDLGVTLISDEEGSLVFRLRRLGRKEHVWTDIHGHRAGNVPDRQKWESEACVEEGENTGSRRRSAGRRERHDLRGSEQVRPWVRAWSSQRGGMKIEHNS